MNLYQVESQFGRWDVSSTMLLRIRLADIKAMLKMAIDACQAQGKYVGICGQGPSDHPDLAMWLLDQGIESMSLNPDSVVETWMYLAGKTI